MINQAGMAQSHNVPENTRRKLSKEAIRPAIQTKQNPITAESLLRSVASVCEVIARVSMFGPRTSVNMEIDHRLTQQDSSLRKHSH